MTALLMLVLSAAVLACGAAQARAQAQKLSPPRLDVAAAALLDADTGQLLYGRNAQAERPIASTTKLMTALVVLEHARLGTVFADPNWYPAAADSQIGLVPGERMNVHDLLLAMLLPSADDAAEDLAFNVGQGSVPRFIDMMNARAAMLGLAHTHYSTPIGLDTPGNYSSAADLVSLARFDLANEPFFRRAVAAPRAVLRTGHVPRVVSNRNDLVGRIPWINGIKTGHTNDAGYVLVASGTRDGTTLIDAVLGTPDEATRDASALSLLDYGFSAFRLVSPVRVGTVVARLPVTGRPKVTAALAAAVSYAHVFARPVRIRTRVVASRAITGPLRRGARAGTLDVLADGRLVARVPLVLAAAVPGPPPSLALAKLAIPITLLSALILALGGAAVATVGRRRVRGSAREAQRRT